ncbi:unnamed protein product [Rotaria sp. Silwood1]|nr:unnamed protein product [Rotaria sp. Silwood1]CAF1644695.1 unnamed protein product [Rotaria sp. Silwood1]
MRLLVLIYLFSQYSLNKCDFIDKYGRLRDKCQQNPSNRDCLQLKSKFSDLIKKCQKLTTQEQLLVCQQVKTKFCTVFPLSCIQSSTTNIVLTTQKPSTTKKLVKTTKSKLIKTTKSSTITSNILINETLTDQEFIKVPFNPDELRLRGEYCIRHGKEKKCKDLLNNLKYTYASCAKNKSITTSPKPEHIDCHSFQSHLCKAFPKFPPCIKKTSN